MKIRILSPKPNSFIPNASVHEARIHPDNERFYQITNGEHAGKELPISMAIILPDAPTYSAEEYNALQADLQQAQEDNEQLRGELHNTADRLAIAAQEIQSWQKKHEWTYRHHEIAMESNKVKLPWLVADGINHARNMLYSNRDIMNDDLGTHVPLWREALRDYAADHYDKLMSALVNGYTIDNKSKALWDGAIKILTGPGNAVDKAKALDKLYKR
ncbi:hypothetical protein SAMN04487969_102461 [Paenibacillus algorifonticola]|uniref:Uncharacterized protein n=1 Tax=Paenibacillus algorifonticola TaxID=684063 RepID=A0A1I2AF74_9BACL|nr:hypothetical protein [Paenibacillus algorifonticola]SFE42621.1 hypothetical protein SAMN04487969_102461 [Paenibacillus algorifonticola]